MFHLFSIMATGLMLLSAPTIQSAETLKHTIGADAYVRRFSNNPGKKEEGFAQRIALKVDLEVDSKTKIKTQTILSGDQWNGDTAGQAVSGNSDNTAGGNPVRLDYGYIETVLPNQVVLRAGRTTANFSDCFNTCDDRRDRLLLMKSYGKFLPVVLFDKRAEGEFNNSEDDRDMYAAALFHLDPTHEWALLYATWVSKNENDILKGVHNFSPYYKYRKGKLKALMVYNWLGQGTNQSIFYHHHHSYAIKVEYSLFGNLRFGAQAINSIDGGLIASGYDTYSFVVNNDPDHNRSNSKLVSLGGFGTLTGNQVDDEFFYVGRVSYDFNNQTTLNTTYGRAKEVVALKKSLMNIYDLQLAHKYTKNIDFKFASAWIRGDRNEVASLFEMNAKF